MSFIVLIQTRTNFQGFLKVICKHNHLPLSFGTALEITKTLKNINSCVWVKNDSSNPKQK